LSLFTHTSNSQLETLLLVIVQCTLFVKQKPESHKTFDLQQLMFNSGNVMACTTCDATLDLDASTVHVSYLPLAHIFETVGINISVVVVFVRAPAHVHALVASIYALCKRTHSFLLSIIMHLISFVSSL
jgi:hypothetical protein